jgi:hypothetical protein
MTNTIFWVVLMTFNPDSIVKLETLEGEGVTYEDCMDYATDIGHQRNQVIACLFIGQD